MPEIVAPALLGPLFSIFPVKTWTATMLMIRNFRAGRGLFSALVLTALVWWYPVTPWAAENEAPLSAPQIEAEAPLSDQAPETPSLLEALRKPRKISFCGEPVPMERQDVVERFEKELLLTLGNRPQAILYLKRQLRYLPHIEAVLEKENLPDDLKYLAVAESALIPDIRSRSGAMGIWQFMPDTGRNHGLTVDSFIDERRDFYTATKAATLYLKKLYAKFGSWSLAAAAYNMGENGLAADIELQQTNDYYDLVLPDETERYLFRILAIKTILASPTDFGFDLTPTDLYPPFDAQTVSLTLDEETTVQSIAAAAGVSYRQMKILNPQIIRHYLPAGRYTLMLPETTAKDLQQKIKALSLAAAKNRPQRMYTVKKGDTLLGIADHFDIPLRALLVWNRLSFNSRIYPGDRLVIKAP